MPKAMRVVTGLLLMAAFVLISLAVVTHFAGSWGVPYFSFKTSRGTPCTNDLTGYTCRQMTLADVEFYGEVDLPDDSQVLESVYRSTHDYRLDATVSVPAGSAPVALLALQESFGGCQPGHLAPVSTVGLAELCVMANDDAITNGSEASGRLYTVGTGLPPDGSRLIALSIRSR